MNDSDADTTNVTVPRRIVPEWVDRLSRYSWAFVGFVAAAGLIVLGLAALREVVIPLVLAGALAVVCSPGVGWLERRRVPRSVGSLLVMLAIVGVVAGAIAMVVVGIVDQADELEERFDDVVAEVDDIVEQAEATELAERLRGSASDVSPTVRDGLGSRVGSWLDSVAGFAAGLILGLVLLYYLLKDGPEIVRRAAERRTPAASAQTERILRQAGGSIRAYFKGRSVLAVVQGVVIGVVVAIMGVPLAFAIGIVNLVGAYIPYLGAFVGGTFAVLMAISEGGVSLALWSLGVVLFVNLVLENVLEPRLVGTTLKMHPIVVLLATVAGGLVAGIVGLVLASPFVAIGTNLFHELEDSGFFGRPSATDDASPD